MVGNDKITSLPDFVAARPTGGAASASGERDAARLAPKSTAPARADEKLVRDIVDITRAVGSLVETPASSMSVTINTHQTTIRCRTCSSRCSKRMALETDKFASSPAPWAAANWRSRCPPSRPRFAGPELPSGGRSSSSSSNGLCQRTKINFRTKEHQTAPNKTNQHPKDRPNSQRWNIQIPDGPFSFIKCFSASWWK